MPQQGNTVTGNTSVHAPPRLSPVEHRMLERGVAILWPESNVAPGTTGAALRALHQRGLMSITYEMAGRSVLTEFRVTPAGRDAYVSYGHPFVPTTLDGDINASR